MKSIMVFVVILSVVLQCNIGIGNITSLFYSPSVYFAGYINGNYDSLIGNYWYQNSCQLAGDTIRMFFYTSEFEEVNRVRHGDFIRIDLYPGNDTAIGRARILFHMARYLEQNISYNVSPVDTVYGFDRIQLYVQDINRCKGGNINLKNISVTTRPIGGTTGEELKLLNGRVRGTIR
jgi:hypothetical protein